MEQFKDYLTNFVQIGPFHYQVIVQPPSGERFVSQAIQCNGHPNRESILKFFADNGKNKDIFFIDI